VKTGVCAAGFTVAR